MNLGSGGSVCVGIADQLKPPLSVLASSQTAATNQREIFGPSYRPIFVCLDSYERINTTPLPCSSHPRGSVTGYAL